MNTVDYTPVPSLSSLQESVAELEAERTLLTDTLAESEAVRTEQANLLFAASSLIADVFYSTETPMDIKTACAKWRKAQRRTKESGHG
jgi:hypothetical protein